MKVMGTVGIITHAGIRPRHAGGEAFPRTGMEHIIMVDKLALPLGLTPWGVHC